MECCHTRSSRYFSNIHIHLAVGYMKRVRAALDRGLAIAGQSTRTRSTPVNDPWDFPALNHDFGLI